MKNLSLFVTLGLVTLMGACNAVNAQMDTDTPDDTQTDGIVELQDESSLEGRYTNDAEGNPMIQDDTVEVPTDEEAVVGSDGTEYPAASDGTTNSGDTTIDNAVDGTGTK